MSKNNDLLSSIKSIANNLQLGSKSATEVADSVNAWIKESSEALKVKIEDEVERSVSKMGFIKRGEFEALKQEVADLKRGGAKKATTTKSAAKKQSKKTAAKSASKRVVAKKSAQKLSKKATVKKVAK